MMPAMLLVLLMLAAPVLAQQEQPPPDASSIKVAIIGAGIGGAYAAYSLSELSPGVHIDVFESSSVVGGRAHSFDLNGTALELGAAIIWEDNLHLYRAAEKLGLDIKWLSDSDDPDGFAVFDGTRFVLNRTGSIWSTLGMAVRYGLSPLLYSRHVYKVWEDHFKPIYDLQDQERRFFQSPEDMLQATGLYNLTQSSCKQHVEEFLCGYWWSWGAQPFINDLVGAINRCNYNQRNTQLNALAGLVSFLPASGHGDLWSVKGGNSRLASALLNASGATLHLQTAVTHIQEDDKGVYSLVTQGTGAASSGSSGPYDAVIIATPLEKAGLTFQPHQLAFQPHPQARPGTQSQSLEEPNFHPPSYTNPLACKWLKCRSSEAEGSHDVGAEAAAGLAADAQGQAAADAQGQAAADAQGQAAADAQRRNAAIDKVQSLAGASSTTAEGDAAVDAGTRLPRTYQQTVTTYVSGALQASYFGVASLPSQRVFVADNSNLPFSSIGPKMVAGRLIYKVFSTEPLAPGAGSLLEQLFGPDVQVLAAHAWEAYPRFSPPEGFAPFQLHAGLCYVNTIESAASAMEMSAIGGRNCALMALAEAKQGRRGRQRDERQGRELQGEGEQDLEGMWVSNAHGERRKQQGEVQEGEQGTQRLPDRPHGEPQPECISSQNADRDVEAAAAAAA